MSQTAPLWVVTPGQRQSVCAVKRGITPSPNSTEVCCGALALIKIIQSEAVFVKLCIVVNCKVSDTTSSQQNCQLKLYMK